TEDGGGTGSEEPDRRGDEHDREGDETEDGERPAELQVPDRRLRQPPRDGHAAGGAEENAMAEGGTRTPVADSEEQGDEGEPAEDRPPEGRQGERVERGRGKAGEDAELHDQRPAVAVARGAARSAAMAPSGKAK